MQKRKNEQKKARKAADGKKKKKIAEPFFILRGKYATSSKELAKLLPAPETVVVPIEAGTENSNDPDPETEQSKKDGKKPKKS